MAPFSEIVLRDLAPTNVADILREAGCDVEASSHPSKNAENLSLNVQYEGADPFSVCVLTQIHGSKDTRFIYMESNGPALTMASTMVAWLLILLSPILAIPNLVVSFFRPETERLPSEEEKKIAIAYEHVISMLESSPAFASSRLYEGRLFP